MVFKNLRYRTKAILIIQAIGMFMGTSTHLVWILKNGFLADNYNAPLFSRIFWDSLTFLDPFAAVLLIVKPKSGVYLTATIILLDIIHNNIFYMDELYLNAPEFNEWIVKYWMIIGQVLFGLFVIFTLKSNLKEIKRCL